jgi:hypothetical protein
MIPGWRPPPGPGSPGVRRHPADSPAIPQPGPRAQRHPSVPAGLPFTPCAVTLDQLHRQGDGLRAAGTTDGTPAHHGNPGSGLSAAEDYFHMKTMRGVRSMPRIDGVVLLTAMSSENPEFLTRDKP